MRFNTHHIHQRKRKAKDLAPYPHPNKWIGGLDRAMLFIAIVGPLFNIPQIAKIYIGQEVAGLAITTYILLLTMKIPWITYALVHKEKPLLITSILWACSHISIIVGILIYG
ncbi:hypothetical protein HOG48_03760 [Candidatus Peregrinibacteria bacterium]|jgi:hypothetical protein|nr:hypothetical protein [Candidatus Peregrinibacteria bacterium]